jgi:DNA invertase Pin-like site-specific DNA recombinase
MDSGNDNITEDVPPPPPRMRGAEYVRMSTEHQQYSTENQGDKIREYASRRGIEIVQTYADEGKSGLRIDGRQALQRLIADVQNGRADFQIILVYDVSRWGRFQDADESAYYEYICRRAGIQVAYCAEQFENDGSPVSTIVKGVKRAMAGEYSRELSAKVFAGQCRLIELGFRQGGPAGYGLRRTLVDVQGAVKTELARGEHKSLQTDRVILMPGPDDEVRIVNDIYRWFIDDGLVESEIAGRLNGMRVQTDLCRDWTRATVHEVLTNEKYVGHNVYNRVSFKLKKLRVVNTPDMWIRREGAFDRHRCARRVLHGAGHHPRARPPLHGRGTDRPAAWPLPPPRLPVGPGDRRIRGHALGIGLRAPLRQPDPGLPDGGLHARSRLPVPGDQPLPAAHPPGDRRTDREADRRAWAARWSAIRQPTCCG